MTTYVRANTWAVIFQKTSTNGYARVTRRVNVQGVFLMVTITDSNNSETTQPNELKFPGNVNQ